MENQTQTPVIEDFEIEWMLKKRPFEIFGTKKQVEIDYGKDAPQILEAFENRGADYTAKYFPALGWHGVGSRWKEYVQFIDRYATEPNQLIFV